MSFNDPIGEIALPEVAKRGSLSADVLPAEVLKGIFAAGIIFIGSQLYSSYRREEREQLAPAP
ncbi:hypothetical protein MYX84_10770 [Acidobacteria bacterium AH-259-O06]|nr:hypothetical protein [Acidobacteria bacterium AH-259-G07]MDA2930411.1 hypothetical protein [Acidobacteria bacterium AH-259-O06]